MGMSSARRARSECRSVSFSGRTSEAGGAQARSLPPGAATPGNARRLTRLRAGREEVFGPVAVRLFLGKLQEETDHDLIAAMTRRNLTAEEDRAKGPKFPVASAVEKVLPLVGAG